MRLQVHPLRFVELLLAGPEQEHGGEVAGLVSFPRNTHGSEA